MVRVKWNQVLENVKETIEFFQSQNVKPTLRTLFYNLVSKNIIGNTRGTYQGLSKLLVRARKDGRLGWDVIVDNVRVTYGEFNDYRFSSRHEEREKEGTDRLLEEFSAKALLDAYFDYTSDATVDRWADQPEVCEIWIEKEALAGTFVQWTRDLEIQIRVNKGYSSWTFIHNNAAALLEKLEDHERATIFYLGDLDPSGVDMERFLKEALAFFGLDETRITFVRLGVTGIQVVKYKLPPRPDDAETLEKLERDPRSKGYDIPYVVELDALIAFVPDKFRVVLRDAITEIWDEEVYSDLVEEAEEINEAVEDHKKEAKKEALERLKELEFEEE